MTIGWLYRWFQTVFGISLWNKSSQQNAAFIAVSGIKGCIVNGSGVIFALSQNTRILAILLLSVVTIIFSGCAVLPQQNEKNLQVNKEQITIHKPKADDSDKKGWWQIGFHRDYENSDEVQWYYDTFIAFKIIKPVISQRRDLNLWRFHRRAVPDKSGHKFSFIFYTNREVGEKIYQVVNNDPVAKQLLAEKHIDRVSFYGINNELRSDIESTSDKKWPIELQKTWPYFIMGVSQTWLGLVEYYQYNLELDDDSDLSEQLEGFKQVSADVDIIWEKSGSHAFLHHLNALFAYQELYIIERRRGRF